MARQDIDLAPLTDPERHFVACLSAGLTPGEAAQEAQITDTKPRDLLGRAKVRSVLGVIRDNVDAALALGKRA